MRDLLARKNKNGKEQKVRIVNITFNSDGDLRKLIYVDKDGNLDEDLPEYFTISERLAEEVDIPPPPPEEE